MYDAGAALVIGLLLMGFAVALAWENKRLILGESLAKEDEDELRRIVADWDGVTELVDFRTVYFGAEELLVTADVAFEPDLDVETINERITQIELALMDHDDQVQKVYIEPEA